MLPLPSYFLHITPHPSTVNDTPNDSASICGRNRSAVPCNGKDPGLVVRSGGIVEGRAPARQRPSPGEGCGGPGGTPAPPFAAGLAGLTAKDPPKRVFYATCGLPVVRNGVRVLEAVTGGR